MSTFIAAAGRDGEASCSNDAAATTVAQTEYGTSSAPKTEAVGRVAVNNLQEFLSSSHWDGSKRYEDITEGEATNKSLYCRWAEWMVKVYKKKGGGGAGGGGQGGNTLRSSTIREYLEKILNTMMKKYGALKYPDFFPQGDHAPNWFKTLLRESCKGVILFPFASPITYVEHLRHALTPTFLFASITSLMYPGTVDSDSFENQRVSGVPMYSSAPGISPQQMDDISRALLGCGTSDALYRLAILQAVRSAGGRSGEAANMQFDLMSFDRNLGLVTVVWPENKTRENKLVIFCPGTSHYNCIYEALSNACEYCCQLSRCYAFLTFSLP